MVAAGVAILFGFSPKFGAVISATPGGVLGGITVVLYGMIGLLGAKIWKENRVDFGNPVNLVPVAAGIIIGIGDVTHPMQLTNHGRAARVLLPVDTRSSSVMFILRKDLKEQGINSLEAFEQWKRPDGRKPIVSVLNRCPRRRA